jgi:hypothetical protein
MTRVYDLFVRYLKSNPECSAADHLKSINALSIVAKRLLEAGEDDADRTFVAAARIRAMDFSTALPVFMGLLIDPNRPHSDVVATARHLESYLVRRTVCALNTGLYGVLFVDLMKIALASPLASDAIAQKLLLETSDSARWPDDLEFGKAWKKFPLYKTLKRSRLAMILRAIESALRNSNLTDPASLSARLHIEHVMPQSWAQWWPLGEGGDPIERERIVQTIGNLTLVKEKLNLKLSNGPWISGDGECKRASLQQHGLLRLNTMLANQEVWNETSIAARAEAMFARAVAVWPRP